MSLSTGSIPSFKERRPFPIYCPLFYNMYWGFNAAQV
ncbi:hypothetical protein OESDEN_09256 [Oesophagostomum dentatum]|uniref:Uncharacterized protein n=1 Tax=Oesophagostomum dentatum TaxID=61180 RepID=A0A0B1T018_OESDE|nr:hypothetical protein OESDEN_09256 [Oesophagostomum dentatum]